MKIIDLTMPIDERTPVFPGDPKQELKTIATIKTHGWNEKRLAFNSHFSTHIDAPYHMLENGKKLTDFPIEKFIGQAIVIDVRNQKIIRSSLATIKTNDIVFFCTGHTARAYSKDFFEENPVISHETTKALIKRKVKMIGLDSYTPDNEPFEVHKMLLNNDILIVENLVNLEELIGQRFDCIILPLKIQDADGAPCRVIALQKNTLF